MSRLFYHVMQDNAGNLLFDVSGTMRLAGTGTAATIYGDEALTVILPNPMTNHPSFGSFKCFLGAGDYDFYMAKAGYTFETLTGVQGHGTMAQQDASAVAITGGQIHDLSVLTVDNPTLLVDNVTHGVGMGIAPIAGRSLRAINVEATGLLIVDSPTLMVDPTAHGVGIGTNGASGHKLAVAGTTWLQGIVGLGRPPQTGNWLVIEYQKSAAHALTLRPNDNDTGGFPAISFQNTTAAGVGSISTTASGTSYNTSSDARLKHAVTALTGALGVVQALRPVAFRWNADDSVGHGFLAHELQAQVPAAVTGEPDAVDPDGDIVPQGLDMSKLVPYLVGAVQMLAEQVQALTARLEAAGA